MKERPILFSAPMVNAILEGRKWQTRRALDRNRLVPLASHDVNGFMKADAVDWRPEGELWHAYSTKWNVKLATIKCPYGAPGNRLWVREAWKPDTEEAGDCGIRYKADGGFANHENSMQGADRWIAVRRPEEQYPQMKPPKWRPSIHMPRWASRITLEITVVRVERLQEIGINDIRSEGVECPSHDFPGGFCLGSCTDLAKAWVDLWNSINAKKHPWESNPWVWVVEFERL